MKIISDWKDTWRYGSVWVFAVLVGMPELYVLVRDSGLIDLSSMPSEASVFRYIALAGLIVRYIDQKKPQVEEDAQA